MRGAPLLRARTRARGRLPSGQCQPGDTTRSQSQGGGGGGDSSFVLDESTGAATALDGGFKDDTIVLVCSRYGTRPGSGCSCC